jgi:hypothetical protein
MPAICIPFGYCPLNLDERIGAISLADLPSLDEAVAEIAKSRTVHNGWLYSPLKRQRDFMSGRISTLPFPSRIFGLPKTHVLAHEDADNEEHLDFLVWCLGFFLGMRLTIGEGGFLDATPIEPRKLTDFSVHHVADAIALSDAYWQTHAKNPQAAKLIEAAIHALFISQYPPYLQFEEFTYLYMALDACFALTKILLDPSAKPTHARRIDWMCGKFGMPTPDWARPDVAGTEISIIRNDTFHEALFFGQPLGFSIYGGNARTAVRPNTLLAMRALVCRLIVALIGRPDCDYVKTPTDTRHKYALDLKQKGLLWRP